MGTLTLNYDVSSIIVATLGLIGIVITHYLTKKRKVDELLFAARKEAYTEFMKNFGMAFGPEKINLKEFDAIKAMETNYERDQRIARIFSQCRLLANFPLEQKLRHLYELVIADIEEKSLEEKDGQRERDYIGYEIEALMRHDLHVAGSSEVFKWEMISLWKRFKIKQRGKTNQRS